MTSVSKHNGAFQIIALTPAGSADPSIAIAASRAGYLGILDLEFVDDPETALDAVRKMSRHAGKNIGIKLNTDDDRFIRAISGNLPGNVSVVILTTGKSEGLSACVETFRAKNCLVVLEATSLARAGSGSAAGVDGLLAKGNEAGGFVGEKTAFVLMQQMIKTFALPVWVQGGIGPHTAAACYSAGAAGVVLDFQLALLRESSLPESVERIITRMDGTETVCIGEQDRFLRVYKRPGAAHHSVLNTEGPSGGDNDSPDALRSAIRGRISWDETAGALWPVGQDASFAATFAGKHGSVGALFKAITEAVRDHVETAKKTDMLQPGSPLAESHATEYPVVQGPMARVSDNASFLARVADAGALPFAAIAQMRPQEITSLLAEVDGLLKGRPWGVGMLGFIDSEHFNSQVKAIEPFSPKFAVLAGGLPSHVALLESKGMRTYVHVPSPSLLDMFVDAGVRRFIFEGNECGGHIGPRTGFVLWETVIEKLLDKFKEGLAPGDFHLLFAGGIHDSASAAAVAAMAAPLAALGAKVGIQMGTAYLLTREIVETRAIASGYQKNALRCDLTRVLETSPGHALRCCDTPFAERFLQKKKQFSAGKLPQEEVRDALERFVVGKSRIAAKGLMRNPGRGTVPGEPYLVPVDEEKQHAEGLYLIGQLAALRNDVVTVRELHKATTVEAAQRLQSLEGPSPVPVPRARKSADIAIIGMSCCFPKAKNLREYWENVLRKVNAIGEIPSKRWDWQVYFDGDKKSRDKIYARWGGFLDDMPFDPTKYGIPPSSLHSIEPVHLMTLEMVGAALKDAGYEGREFARERTSVIIGTGAGIGELGQKYVMRSTLPLVFEIDSDEVMNRFNEWTEDSFPGILMNVLAGRVANRFNLGGVNYTIDAACASSLAALYDASRELETGSSDMVIVGGVDACQSPFTYTCFSKTNALSPTGACKVFDEKADGTVISEGLAFLVVKRLEDAERDGDRIYAVVKSVAGSSDGRGMGMTAPRVEGQMLAMKRAYEKAGFSPATVELFEAHGTGTVVGDLVEAESATRLLQESGAASQNCAIGSVKSMIGHTKGAAGLAGVIKAALSLYHKVLPPTMGVDKPNPKLDFLNGPLYINTEVRPWAGEGGSARRAGVSAFGFGGTNFHAVLEQYEGRIESERSAVDAWSAELFLWAGQSKDEIVAAVRSLEQALDAGARPPLRDIAFTLWELFREKTKKSGSDASRLAIVASSPDDLKEKLSAAVRSLNDVNCAAVSDQKGTFYSGGSPGPGKIAFLFPGQGSQYPNMLKEVSVLFPEVLDAFERANAALKERFPGKLSSLVFPPPRFSPEHEAEQRKRLAETNVAQPALAAASRGMLNLLQSMSLRPDMTAGHSYGEYPALAAAGVFGEDALYTLSEARGRFIIEAAKGSDLGAMAAVKANAAQLKEIIDGIQGVVIANINSPRQTVISGEKAALEKAISALKERQIHAQLLPVSGAFHSPAVAPAKELFSDFLQTVEFASPRTEVFSNTSAAPHGSSAQEIRSCLSEHMVKPVEFIREIEAMYERGARTFVEVGPGSVLTSLTKQILDTRTFLAVATDSQGQPPLAQLLKTLGQLAVNHVPLTLEPLFRRRALRRLALDNLAAEGKEEYSATTWLVNGAGVRQPSKQMRQREDRPFEGTYRLRERRRDRRTQKEAAQHAPMKQSPQSQQQGPEAHSHPVASQANVPFGRRLSAGGDPDVVMQQYQELMTHFLETQKSVMMAYLQGETPALAATDSGQVFHAAGEEQPQQAPAAKRLRPELLPDPAQSQAVNEAFALRAGEVASAAVPGNGGKAGHVSAKSNLEKALLRAAGEKTGYPTEMLDPDLDIEADLGIDSIKRVEIMGAFIKGLPLAEQEKLQPAMEDFSRLKTFRKILAAVHGALPSAAARETAPAAVPGNGGTDRVSRDGDLEQELLRVVGEKTGYPADMLSPDLDIEADLGIDSIKRVEIMGAFAQYFGDREDRQKILSSMDELSRFKTLNAILCRTREILSSNGHTSGRASELHEEKAGSFAGSPKNNVSEDYVMNALITVTSGKTGYPSDLLKLDADIEADLGIDSIKRVEIISAFTKCFSDGDGQKVLMITDELSKLKTLNAVIDRTMRTLVIESGQPVVNPGKIGASEGLLFAGQKEITRAENEHVPRFLLEPVVTSAVEDTIRFSGKEVFIITDDGRGVAETVAQNLAQRGPRAIIVKMASPAEQNKGLSFSADLTNPGIVDALVREIRDQHGPIAGLIHLLPLGHADPFSEMDLPAWQNSLAKEVKSLFYLAKSLAGDLRSAGKKERGWLIAATGLNTKSPASNNGAFFPGQAGIAGLLKTIAQEWPEVSCRAVHMDTMNSVGTLSGQIVAELAAGESAVEVEYSGLDRMFYKARRAPLDRQTGPGTGISKDWVVMVTGGAAGITADVALELAEKYQPTLILVGRSAFPEEESSETAGRTSSKEIKEALMKKMQGGGATITPAKVNAAQARLLKDREMRKNAASMRRAGATVHYFQADVRDEKTFGNVIDTIYDSFGRLDGVIHGSGIIEDKLIEDKSAESFDRVFDTKVMSGFILSRKLRPASLKFLAFFTSVAGCFGNRGQADYAAANEVVNKLAVFLDRRWEGRIFGINWGPWKKGMVSPELEKQFRTKGIQLIPPDGGSRIFDEELRFGAKGDAEVVIGDGPWGM